MFKLFRKNFVIEIKDYWPYEYFLKYLSKYIIVPNRFLSKATNFALFDKNVEYQDFYCYLLHFRIDRHLIFVNFQVETQTLFHHVELSGPGARVLYLHPIYSVRWPLNQTSMEIRCHSTGVTLFRNLWHKNKPLRPNTWCVTLKWVPHKLARCLVTEQGLGDAGSMAALQTQTQDATIQTLLFFKLPITV